MLNKRCFLLLIIYFNNFYIGLKLIDFFILKGFLFFHNLWSFNEIFFTMVILNLKEAYENNTTGPGRAS